MSSKRMSHDDLMRIYREYHTDRPIAYGPPSAMISHLHREVLELKAMIFVLLKNIEEVEEYADQEEQDEL